MLRVAQELKQNTLIIRVAETLSAESPFKKLFAEWAKFASADQDIFAYRRRFGLSSEDYFQKSSGELRGSAESDLHGRLREEPDFSQTRH